MSAKGRRTARGNRSGLVILGLIILVAGAAALADGLGWLTGTTGSHRHLLTGWETQYVHTDNWVWIVVAVACALIAIGCLRWLLVQFRRDATSSLQLEPDRRRGITRLDTRIATDALVDEILALPGVYKARAWMTGSAARLELHLNVSISDRADLRATHERVEADALPHLAGALELPSLPALVAYRVDSS